MNFVTRKEFRDALLTLYKELHEETKTKRDPRERNNADQKVVIPSSVIAKLDPESTIETRKEEASKEADSRYHFWSLVVGWATLAAVVGYATIAAFQWCETRRQIKDFEKAQAAQLVIEDFAITPNIPYINDWTQKFTLVNRGLTIAKDISMQRGTPFGSFIPGTMYPDRKYLAELLAMGKPLNDEWGGFDLGAGQERPFEFHVGQIDPEALSRTGKDGVVSFVSIGYRDAFGNEGINSECLVYSPISDRWVICMAGR
jgi:hypothetical protein